MTTVHPHTTLPDAFEGWCIVELFGHRKVAGVGRIIDLGLGPMLQLAVYLPDSDAPIARPAYAPGAIYALHPCDGDTARRNAAIYAPYALPPGVTPTDHEADAPW